MNNIPLERFFDRLRLPTEYPYLHLIHKSNETMTASDTLDVRFGVLMVIEQVILLVMRYIGGSYRQHICLAVLPLVKGSVARIPSHLLGPFLVKMNNQVCNSIQSKHTGIEKSKVIFVHAILSTMYDYGSCLYATFRVLWLMFAPIILFPSVIYLVFFYHPFPPTSNTGEKRELLVDWKFVKICLPALLTSLLVMVDASYVFEFSRQALVILFIVIVGIVYYKAPNKRCQVYVLLPITALAFILLSSLDLDLPPSTLKAGFYFDTTNDRAVRIAERWPSNKRTYTTKMMTKWTLNGDMRTLIPFVLNKPCNIPFQRVYVPVPGEVEAVSLDIFSSSENYSEKKPVFLVSSGLNGGSNDAYVRDFIQRRIDEGSIVAVVVTRGLMDSHIIGDTLPHYARTTDIDAAARVLRKAIAKDQMLVGVGYSMGGISLGNYVARSGKRCQLDAAVSISGALNAREQLGHTRSRWLFQPVLAGKMKRTLNQKFGTRIQSRLGPDGYFKFMKSSDVVSLDETIAKYHGYNDTYTYYSEMSIIGDLKNHHSQDRVKDVAIPMLFVNALDDTFGSWRCLGTPDEIVKSADGNVFILLTSKGGHVGWPTGSFPFVDAWKWMNDLPKTFVDAVHEIENE